MKLTVNQEPKSNHDNIIDIRAAVEKAVKAEKEACQGMSVPDNAKGNNPDSTSARLARAKECFPRMAFPWGILPTPLSDSFKQMAESLGTLPDAIPGIAMSVFSSVLGRKVLVQGKPDHKTVMLQWVLEVSTMGTTKTAKLENLMTPLKKLQKNADDQFEADKKAWNALSAEEQKTTPRPERARGYWAGAYTNEGLRNELPGHPTGGFMLALDEGSKFISGQNAYRGGRGSDREDTCTLYNGDAGRIIRAGEIYSIPPCAVSMAGGIQPLVLVRTLGGEKGLYLEDGTVTRILMVYNPSVHIDVSYKNAWSAENQAAWEKLIFDALERVNSITESLTMTLTEEAAEYFYDIWRNNKNRLSKEYIKLPLIDGFIMKSITYALRFSGMLACLKAVHDNKPIPLTISLDQIKDAIRLAEYYMGHSVDIAGLLLDEAAIEKKPAVITEETSNLAHVLDSLRGDVENNLLAIGHISERYNKLFPARPNFKPVSARKIGEILSIAELDKTPGLHDANGQKRVRCHLWNEKTETFIKTTSLTPQRLLIEENQEVRVRDIVNATSRNVSYLPCANTETETSETSQNTTSRSQHTGNTAFRDIEHPRRCCTVLPMMETLF